MMWLGREWWYGGGDSGEDSGGSSSNNGDTGASRHNDVGGDNNDNNNNKNTVTLYTRMAKLLCLDSRIWKHKDTFIIVAKATTTLPYAGVCVVVRRV